MGTSMGRTDIQRAFGRAVRARRDSLELSQEALAEASELHRTYIGAIERGERNVSLQNICRIALALKTTASELLGQAERSSTPARARPVARVRR
jgi:transcriptional regulator with XRE-family HTH domain